MMLLSCKKKPTGNQTGSCRIIDFCKELSILAGSPPPHPSFLSFPTLCNPTSMDTVLDTTSVLPVPPLWNLSSCTTTSCVHVSLLSSNHIDGMSQALSCVRAEINLVQFLPLNDSGASVEANDVTVWQVNAKEVRQSIWWALPLSAREGGSAWAEYWRVGRHMPVWSDREGPLGRKLWDFSEMLL